MAFYNRLTFVRLIGNSDFAIDAAAESLPYDHPHTKNWQEMCKKEGLAPKEIDKNFARSVAKKVMLERRITKLYFEPAKYPPPEGEWDASDDIVFGHLKNYIQNSAKLCGSPLVYRMVVNIKQGFGAAIGIEEAKAKSALWDLKTMLTTVMKTLLTTCTAAHLLSWCSATS